MALRLSQPPLASSSLPPPSSSSSTSTSLQTISFSFHPQHLPSFRHKTTTTSRNFTGRLSRSREYSGREDTELGVTSTAEEEVEQPEPDPDPHDLEYISQIKRVLELLKKNRDMLFSEVKLTIMIEDPREVERRRLLGIDDLDGPTREELAEVLEESSLPLHHRRHCQPLSENSGLTHHKKPDLPPVMGTDGVDIAPTNF